MRCEYTYFLEKTSIVYLNCLRLCDQKCANNQYLTELTMTAEVTKPK